MLISDDSDQCPLVLNSTGLRRDSAGTLMLMYDAENLRRKKKKKFMWIFETFETRHFELLRVVIHLL